jgi:D-lactate dehydrogenase (cytochrome)
MLVSILAPKNLPRSEPQQLSSAVEPLRVRFGNRLVTSQAVRDQHAHTTTWIAPQPPDAVVMAQATVDIQDVVRICAPRSVPVIAFGTGTSLEGQVNAPAGGVCIDLRDMNRVLAVHADDLDCVIEPGVTRKALNNHIRDQGLFFPLDSGADASLGGMASTRASGTNAARYGTMRENILALKVVRGDGEIITTGTRARKSSAGYDLTHLFIGAEGTLGIISELTIKPPVLDVTGLTARSAIRTQNRVIVGLHGDDRLLQAGQDLLRLRPVSAPAWRYRRGRHVG